MIFFYGNFKIISTFSFKTVIWSHEEMSLQKPDQRGEIVNFVCGGFSKDFDQLAIGSLDGRIYKYDIQAKVQLS